MEKKKTDDYKREMREAVGVLGAPWRAPGQPQVAGASPQVGPQTPCPAGLHLLLDQAAGVDGHSRLCAGKNADSSS